MARLQIRSKNLSILIALLFLGATAMADHAEPALEFGALASAGSACHPADGEPVKIQLDEGFLQIPVSMLLKKIAGESQKRGVCSFALPIQVPQGYQVSVSQLMAPGYVNLGQGVSGKINLEIFKAGAQGDQLVYKEKAENGRLRKTILFEKEEALFESTCGEAFILRGNAGFLLNEGLKRSTMSLDLIQLKVDLKKCKSLRH